MEKKKATQLLHDEGQSLWLDNITRALLRALFHGLSDRVFDHARGWSGTLPRHVVRFP
jgi:hypothetical protein